MSSSSAAKEYPRDVIGYGRNAPHPKWPNNARIALNFVLNYEEGSEGCILHGDSHSEHLLSEIVGAAPLPGVRHINMESLYDYGARAGFWRLHRILTGHKIPVTVYAVGMALERNPDAGKAMIESGWEVASHGYRWIDYQYVSPETEREHISKTIKIHEKILGQRPLGIYQGKPNENTRGLIVEEGGFLYDSDSYADDLPYYDYSYDKPHLIIPYTLDVNDMRFSQGLECDRYFEYLKNCFDTLYEEGTTAPKMMTVALHCRIVGRPARAAGLIKFLKYVGTKSDVWHARRVDIARHWREHHPPKSHSAAPTPKASL